MTTLPEVSPAAPTTATWLLFGERAGRRAAGGAGGRRRPRRPAWGRPRRTLAFDRGRGPSPQIPWRRGGPIAEAPEQGPIRLVGGPVGAAFRAALEVALEPRFV